MNSLLNQIYSNLHFILVDDGSTDNSRSICDSYAAKDSRIAVIHQKNSGVSNARNKGLEQSGEEYVMFVDADDYVEPTYVYDLYWGLVYHHADLSITPGYDEDENGNLLFHWNEFDHSHIIDIDSYDWNGSEQHPIVWGALFKRNLIGDIRFDSSYYVGEDSLFFAEYLKKVKTLYYVHKPLYHYVNYPQSAAFGNFDIKKLTELDAWKEICIEYNYRFDISAAYAMRCKNFCTKYYSDSTFKKQYFENVVGEYRENYSSLVKLYMKKSLYKQLITALAFKIAPRMFCTIKSSKKA